MRRLGGLVWAVLLVVLGACDAAKSEDQKSCLQEAVGHFSSLSPTGQGCGIGALDLSATEVVVTVSNFGAAGVSQDFIYGTGEGDPATATGVTIFGVAAHACTLTCNSDVPISLALHCEHAPNACDESFVIE